MGEAFRLVPELFAHELTAIGYKLEDQRLTLACAEPIDVAPAARDLGLPRASRWPDASSPTLSPLEHLMNAVYPRLSPGEESTGTALATTPAPVATPEPASLVSAPEVAVPAESLSSWRPRWRLLCRPQRRACLRMSTSR